MNSTRRRWRATPIALALCALLVFALSAWMRLDEYDPLLNLPTEGFKGSPEHLRRIEAQLDILQAESLEESIAQVTDWRFYQYPGVPEPSSATPPDLAWVVSSRRTPKLIEDFAALGPAAQERSRAALKQVLEYHLDALDRGLAYRANPNRSGQGTTRVDGTKYGMCTMLLVAADSGDVEAIVEAVRTLQQSSEGRQEEYEAQNISGRVRAMFAEPDAWFVIDVLRYAASRAPAESGNLAQQYEELLAGYKSSNIPILAWHASVNHFDYVHIYENVPVDDDPSKHLRTIRTVRMGRPSPAERAAAETLADTFLELAENR